MRPALRSAGSVARRATARGTAAGARRRPTAPCPRRASRVARFCAARARRSQSRQPALACDLGVGQEAEPEQRVVQLVGVARRRARPRRARARSPRGRAGRGRRPSPGRASGAPSPPACGAPRAARRRGRRRAAPSGLRARAATARSGRARRPRSRPPRCRAAARSRPSMSIASCRQSSSVCATSG